jgi:hypothetical protein
LSLGLKRNPNLLSTPFSSLQDTPAHEWTTRFQRIFVKPKKKIAIEKEKI